MTVKELIKELQKYDSDIEVIADTQDGACYDVAVVELVEAKNPMTKDTVKVVWIS